MLRVACWLLCVVWCLLCGVESCCVDNGLLYGRVCCLLVVATALKACVVCCVLLVDCCSLRAVWSCVVCCLVLSGA